MRPQVKKVYANENDEAVIICNHCNKKKKVNVSSLKESRRYFSVTCPCGYSFKVSIERRKYYRKDVHLWGEYSKCVNLKGSYNYIKAAQQNFDIMVKDLSMTGLRFQCPDGLNLAVGDVIQVRFHLDNAPRSVIAREAVIRWANNVSAAGEFCDKVDDQALAFYLLP